MSASTTIQWTDKTWNPVTGCTKVSPGCAHCYAEGVAERFWAKQYGQIAVEAPIGDCTVEGDANIVFRDRQFTDVQTHENRLLEPLSWRKPARVFVNSMSDLFHEDVSDEFISNVFAVMALAPRHTFQVLTKRAERMRAYLEEMSSDPDAYCFAWAREMDGAPLIASEIWPLPNVWLGVSVENRHWLERIDVLKDVPAAVRFVSFEPLLEGLGALVLDGIHWCIFGGESGPSARPCEIAWITGGLSECRRQNVPPFVKQLGALPLFRDCEPMGMCARGCQCFASGAKRLKDRKGGDIQEWPADLQVREYPQ